MTDAAIPGLTRHFCTLGQRQVHYRRMGKGAPLIAIHGLPRSSKSMIPFMQMAAEKFTVIAPDLAGYGNSWPLASRGYDMPAFSDYVDDINNFVIELGIKRAAVYGEGGGAAVALQLIARDPQRFACAALNGLPMQSEAQVTQAPQFIPIFEPKWDGSHLAWLWAFLREENCFSPWWDKALSTRISADMPSPDELQNRLSQFLAGSQHGRGYHRGILSALKFMPAYHISTIGVPTLFTGSPNHHQYLSRARISSPSTLCSFVPAANLIEARTNAVEFIATHVGKIDSPPPSPSVKPVTGALWDDFVSVPGGQLHVQMNTDASTVPVLVQHDAASSVGTVEAISKSFIGRRTVLAFDLPGSGESDNTIGYDNVDVGTYAQVLNGAVETLGLEKLDFYGMWGGGFVGLDLAIMNPKRIRRLVMSNVFEHTGEEQRQIQQNYTPEITPVWHGGHLMQCWHQMRDQGIYYPWFDRTAKGVIKREPFLDTAMVHERVCSLLKAGNMYRTAYQAHFSYSTYANLKKSPVPTLIATTKWDPNNAHTQAAAKAAPNATFQYLDEDFTKWGESFLPFLEAVDLSRALTH